MNYNYKIEREKLFSFEGLDSVMKTKEHVTKCINLSGAVMMEKAINILTGNSFMMQACVDFLVEKKIIEEVEQKALIPGQHRIFIKGTNYNQE